jgi:hypothetical protein
MTRSKFYVRVWNSARDTILSQLPASRFLDTVNLAPYLLVLSVRLQRTDRNEQT